MEHGTDGARRTIEGRELRFVRRAGDGRTLSAAELAALDLTNDTIERVVSSAARRIAASADGSFSENIVTD